MNHIPALNELSDRFQRAGAALVEAYAKRRSVSSDDGSVTPIELVDAVRQFFEVAERVDGADRSRVTEEDIDQIGDHALNLTTDLVTWAQQLQLRPVQTEIEQLPIAIADWVIRHGGHIRTLEPIVNALAEVANTQHDAESLRRLVRFMGQVISATEEAVKQDLEKANPGRPWRLIHLNRGIVATRSNDLKMMEEVFDDLIRYLPDEAGSFFEEGMRQMEALDYPQPVRDVMARYFAAWTQHRMH